ncbi:isoprenoid biosynthesis protein ElbB [Saccharobesus litoralis]|uniref:Glyoxalase n=1 Tax=Saccharobesus litoralis TaxID=2172099 RepID=A0A2S0VR07_9ALTE|nr:isoprenoid biosynthesis glyoxalase ElbB [Saccharobesus litoralis]AWB66612.1 isoprenoid biosynthesis protein ElbB [Saccharobesus litoralis]
MTKNIAVVLSGCGYQDGAEIQESVLTLLAINQQGANYQCFAPDILQLKVVDHYRQQEVSESRNVLVEAARIARCDIKPLTEYSANDFDAIIFPGGFGAALNLSDFALQGPDSSVNADVSAAINNTYQAQKPIGALCIAPVLLAKLITGAKLTIGSDQATAQAIESLNCTHENTTHGEIVIDKENKLVTTPCYMLDANIGQIADGANKLVQAILDLA